MFVQEHLELAAEGGTSVVMTRFVLGAAAAQHELHTTASDDSSGPLSPHRPVCGLCAYNYEYTYTWLRLPYGLQECGKGWWFVFMSEYGKQRCVGRLLVLLLGRMMSHRTRAVLRRTFPPLGTGIRFGSGGPSTSSPFHIAERCVLCPISCLVKFILKVGFVFL